MKFGTVVLYNVTKKIVEIFFQNFSYRDDVVINYLIFWKMRRKMAKIYCFLKLTLCQLEKKHFQNLFSAFKSQDNMQIDYI